MIVLFLPFLGQGPALGIWRPEKEKGGGKKKREKRTPEPQGYRGEDDSTC